MKGLQLTGKQRGSKRTRACQGRQGGRGSPRRQEGCLHPSINTITINQGSPSDASGGRQRSWECEAGRAAETAQHSKLCAHQKRTPVVAVSD